MKRKRQDEDVPESLAAMIVQQPFLPVQLSVQLPHWIFQKFKTLKSTYTSSLAPQATLALAPPPGVALAPTMVARFECPICTDVLLNRVTLSCSHTLCIQCFETHFLGAGIDIRVSGHEAAKQVASIDVPVCCPMCRQNKTTAVEVLANKGGGSVSREQLDALGSLAKLTFQQDSYKVLDACIYCETKFEHPLEQLGDNTMHIWTCPSRGLRCKSCKQAVPCKPSATMAVQEHVKVCQGASKCLDCGSEVQLQQLGAHAKEHLEVKESMTRLAQDLELVRVGQLGIREMPLDRLAELVRQLQDCIHDPFS